VGEAEGEPVRGGAGPSGEVEGNRADELAERAGASGDPPIDPGTDEKESDGGGDDAARGADGGGEELGSGGVCEGDGMGAGGDREGDGDGVEGGVEGGAGAQGANLTVPFGREEGPTPGPHATGVPRYPPQGQSHDVGGDSRVDGPSGAAPATLCLNV